MTFIRHINVDATSLHLYKIVCIDINAKCNRHEPAWVCFTWTHIFGFYGLVERRYPCTVYTQQVHDVSATSHKRRCNVMTFKQRRVYWLNLPLTDSEKPLPTHLLQVQQVRSTTQIYITKTYLYNFDPLKPHFYIVKLGFTGVYIIFLISAQKHRLWVLVRTASLMFWAEIWKNIKFFI